MKLQDKIWSACDTKRALNIKTTIRVLITGRTKFPQTTGVMEADSIIGEFHDQK